MTSPKMIDEIMLHLVAIRVLTLLSLDKMAAILQITFWNEFS